MFARIVALLAVTFASVTAIDTAASAKALTFDKVEAVVDAELQKLNRSAPGALLARGDVAAVLAELKRQEWEPSDPNSIVEDALPDQHFLVRMLREPRSKAFASSVGKLPRGYDRLEHLSRLSDGQSMIDRLIDTPDGAKMIEYMATTDGGRNLGDMLSQSPNGANFNKATGHLYTRDDLIERLRKAQPKTVATKEKPKGKKK
jgi:hypothetical protein